MAKRTRGRYALAGVDPPASRAVPHVQGGGASFTGRRIGAQSVRGGRRCQRKRSRARPVRKLAGVPWDRAIGTSA